jgi:uncharacterized protein (DUF849 family)
MNAIGAVEADGVRTGLEDNIWYDEQRTIPATNEALIRRVASFAKTLGRKIATPAETRRMLGLKSD